MDKGTGCKKTGIYNTVCVIMRTTVQIRCRADAFDKLTVYIQVRRETLCGKISNVRRAISRCVKISSDQKMVGQDNIVDLNFDSFSKVVYYTLNDIVLQRTAPSNLTVSIQRITAVE